MEEKEIEKIKKMLPQEFMDIAPKIFNGWTLALISKGSHGFRFQLQSEPPESENTGKIKCAMGKTFEEALKKAIKLTRGGKNPPRKTNTPPNPK